MVIIIRLEDAIFKEKLVCSFPTTKNSEIMEKLDISLHTLQKMVKKLKLAKDEKFIKNIHKEAIKAKIKKENQRRKNYSPSRIQRNIIIGSLLGDGSLALYGRSKNAHYREHGCRAQDGYRIWKKDKLSSLDFKFSSKGLNGKLSSPSHPIYTELYHDFYDLKKNKVITKNNIKYLDHPIGLACLFMDDGSLVAKHIKNTFGISFSLKKHPDGKGYLLFLGKRNEIYNFLEIVRPFVEQIPCMKYKVDLLEKMKDKKATLTNRSPEKQIILSPLKIVDKSYSDNEISRIVALKKAKRTDKFIAQSIGRSYWGTVDKIRRLRKDKLL